MEDKKYSYTIKWTQPYTNWSHDELLCETEAMLVELMVEIGGLSEAQEVLKRFAKQ